MKSAEEYASWGDSASLEDIPEQPESSPDVGPVRPLFNFSDREDDEDRPLDTPKFNKEHSGVRNDWPNPEELAAEHKFIYRNREERKAFIEKYRDAAEFHKYWSTDCAGESSEDRDPKAKKILLFTDMEELLFDLVERPVSSNCFPVDLSNGTDSFQLWLSPRHSLAEMLKALSGLSETVEVGVFIKEDPEVVDTLVEAIEEWARVPGLFKHRFYSNDCDYSYKDHTT